MFSLLTGKSPGDVMDHRLWRWPSGDYQTFRDLFNGGLLVLGRTGSGKTSSVLRQVASGIIGHPRSGGFILAASPSDVRQWQAIFAAAGMSNKLIVFDEMQTFRCNALDFLLQNGGGTRDVVKALTTIGEVLSLASPGGGDGGDKFFVQNEYRLLWSALEIVKRAKGKIKPDVLQDFINSAAQSQEQVTSKEWEQNSFHAKCLAEADAKPKSAIEAFDYQLAESYWLKEFPQMASKTRSGILAGVMNTIFTFNTGYVRELIGTTTNISPAAFADGYFVLVNTPIARMGEEGAFILAIWKYLAQWYTLRRDPDADNPPLVGFVDEMQNTLSSMDSVFLAECRKYRGCLVGLTQGVSSFYANTKGEQGKARVNAMLTNFSHKVFLALGDFESASWASSLVGNERKMTSGASEVEQSESPLGWLGPASGYRTNIGETWRAVLEPTEFMYGLRTGGKANQFLCDSIVIRSGEAFASGRNWLWMAWSQQ